MYITFKETEQLYRFVLEHEDFVTQSTLQLVPVNELPDWVDEEYRTEPFIALTNKAWKSQILLVVESPAMKNAIEELTDVLQQKRMIHAFTSTSPVHDLLGVRVCTRVSSAKLLGLYKAAVSIADQLQITIPTIIVVEQEECPGMRGQTHTLLDDDDNPIGDIITVVLQGKAGMIHTLAHEMRHCWQEYKTESFYEDYKDISEIGLDYMDQNEEIDADAYASLYLNSLGYDGIKYCVEIDEVGAFTQYLNKVEVRMKQLKAIGTSY